MARGVGASLVFAAEQPLERMPEFLALADVLVSPRRGGQNTPLKLYSYMHTGIPIVATDLPTHRQVLDEETAVLCEPSASALGSAIAAVLNDPRRYSGLGQAARDCVREKHTPANDSLDSC